METDEDEDEEVTIVKTLSKKQVDTTKENARHLRYFKALKIAKVAKKAAENAGKNKDEIAEAVGRTAGETVRALLVQRRGKGEAWTLSGDKEEVKGVAIYVAMNFGGSKAAQGAAACAFEDVIELSCDEEECGSSGVDGSGGRDARGGTSEIWPTSTTPDGRSEARKVVVSEFAVNDFIKAITGRLQSLDAAKATAKKKTRKKKKKRKTTGLGILPRTSAGAAGATADADAVIKNAMSGMHLPLLPLPPGALDKTNPRNRVRQISERKMADGTVDEDPEEEDARANGSSDNDAEEASEKERLKKMTQAQRKRRKSENQQGNRSSSRSGGRSRGKRQRSGGGASSANATAATGTNDPPKGHWKWLKLLRDKEERKKARGGESGLESTDEDGGESGDDEGGLESMDEDDGELGIINKQGEGSGKGEGGLESMDEEGGECDEGDDGDDTEVVSDSDTESETEMRDVVVILDDKSTDEDGGESAEGSQEENASSPASSTNGSDEVFNAAGTGDVPEDSAGGGAGGGGDEGQGKVKRWCAVLCNITAAEVAMVLLRRFGKDVCLTNGLSPKMVTKRLLSLKKIELGEEEEGFADVEARVQSVLDDNMEKVFTQHPSKAQCFCLSGKGQTLATEAVQDL